MRNTSRTIAAAAGVLVLGAVALADDTQAPPAEPTALADAMRPLIAPSETASYAAMETDPERKPPAGLRKWLNQEPRAADPFDGFARPVTNVSFHHPFIWNELRPLFMYHSFPGTGVLDGGHLKLYALQAFFKLTDDIQFMAYKDGYVDFNAGAFPSDSGFADLAFGLKLKMWEDLEDENGPATFAVGLGYETTTGDKEVLESGGNGFFDLFGSYARAVGKVNFIGTAGVYLPRDNDQDNRTYHYHVHLDTHLGDKLQPLVEVNGFHYDANAKRNAGLGPSVPLGIEGFDYTTLGSGDVRGNDVVSGAVGFRYTLSEDLSWGIAYETPLTSRKDIMGNRWTLDLVLRF